MMAAVYKPVELLYERMMRRVVKQDDGCWIFTGSVISTGYGSVGAGTGSKSITTHRLAVMHRDGEIPEGMTIDHACHDSYTCTEKPCPHRRCVNPDHLRVMSIKDNNARQWDRGLCRKGHPLVAKSDGKRHCIECKNEKRRKRNGNTSSDYWARLRGETPAA